MSELKPCPFCGGSAKLFGGYMSGETHSVFCKNGHSFECGTMDEKEAIDAWNTRATPKEFAYAHEHIAAAIQAAEVRGYERAIDDACEILFSAASKKDKDGDFTKKMQGASLIVACNAIRALKKGGE